MRESRQGRTGSGAPCESLHSRLCTPARFLSPAGDRAGRAEKILNLFEGCGAGASGFFWLKERENGIVSYFMRGVVLTYGGISTTI